MGQGITSLLTLCKQGGKDLYYLGPWLRGCEYESEDDIQPEGVRKEAGGLLSVAVCDVIFVCV